MADKENSGKREEVPLERIVLSNMHSIKALIDVLVEKGLVSFRRRQPVKWTTYSIDRSAGG